jgi:hypothetical protein
MTYTFGMKAKKVKENYLKGIKKKIKTNNKLNLSFK